MHFKNATNVRYALDRIALEVYLRTHPDEPWLTREAVALLSTMLKPTDRDWSGVQGGVLCGWREEHPTWLAWRVIRFGSIEYPACSRRSGMRKYAGSISGACGNLASYLDK